MNKTRIENDSIGAIKVPNDKYWGAQTQRALVNFQIGMEIMPKDIIKSLALIKQAAAMVNADLGILARSKAKLIAKVCARINKGELDEHFPLTIWQSGSATQTNMNVNEVVAHLTNLHPNDDVNKSQSTNDVFPTAMHIASLLALKEKLLPALQFLRQELYKKQREFSKVLKIGRTHLQDALPMTVGQEFSGYVAQIDFAIKNIQNSTNNLKYLSIGGTAVGTGLNAPKLFAKKMTKVLSGATGLKLVSAPNKFCLLASHDALLTVSGALKPKVPII
jgi:fumarate hydratase class II